MPAYLERSTSDLMDLTELVRGRLSSQERLTLGALITIDVHARDVVAELADANVKNVSGGRGHRRGNGGLVDGYMVHGVWGSGRICAAVFRCQIEQPQFLQFSS